MEEIDVEDFVKDAVSKYREKSTCFGFEDIEIWENSVEVEGYTYFTYGPDQAYKISSFEYLEQLSPGERERISDKAKELYRSWGNKGDFKNEEERFEFIGYATDCLDYAQRAKDLVSKLNKIEKVSAACDDDGETIYVEVSIKQEFSKVFEDLTLEEFESEERMRSSIEEVMGWIKSYKYG